MSTPKQAKRTLQDSSRSGMANQHLTQHSQQGKQMQQGDTMDPGQPGWRSPVHRPRAATLVQTSSFGLAPTSVGAFLFVVRKRLSLRQSL